MLDIYRTKQDIHCPEAITPGLNAYSQSCVNRLTSDKPPKCCRVCDPGKEVLARAKPDAIAPNLLCKCGMKPVRGFYLCEECLEIDKQRRAGAQRYCKTCRNEVGKLKQYCEPCRLQNKKDHNAKRIERVKAERELNPRKCKGCGGEVEARKQYCAPCAHKSKLAITAQSKKKFRLKQKKLKQ